MSSDNHKICLLFRANICLLSKLVVVYFFSSLINKVICLSILFPPQSERNAGSSCEKKKLITRPRMLQQRQNLYVLLYAPLSVMEAQLLCFPNSTAPIASPAATWFQGHRSACNVHREPSWNRRRKKKLINRKDSLCKYIFSHPAGLSNSHYGSLAVMIQKMENVSLCQRLPPPVHHFLLFFSSNPNTSFQAVPSNFKDVWFGWQPKPVDSLLDILLLLFSSYSCWLFQTTFLPGLSVNITPLLVHVDLWDTQTGTDTRRLEMSARRTWTQRVLSEISSFDSVHDNLQFRVLVQNHKCPHSQCNWAICSFTRLWLTFTAGR